MSADVLSAILVFAGLLLTQYLMHRRWTSDQDDKRRNENDDLLNRMAAQNNSVVDNALRVAQIHADDAERARLLAVETANHHAECRAEVASLSGRLEELRERIGENERTMQQQSLMAEEDRGIKHDALTALTVSEGTVHLVKTFVAKCSCGAFEPIQSLVAEFHARAPALVEMNSHIRAKPGTLSEVVASERLSES